MARSVFVVAFAMLTAFPVPGAAQRSSAAQCIDLQGQHLVNRCNAQITVLYCYEDTSDSTFSCHQMVSGRRVPAGGGATLRPGGREGLPPGGQRLIWAACPTPKTIVGWDRTRGDRYSCS